MLLSEGAAKRLDAYRYQLVGLIGEEEEQAFANNDVSVDDILMAAVVSSDEHPRLIAYLSMTMLALAKDEKELLLACRLADVAVQRQKDEGTSCS